MSVVAERRARKAAGWSTAQQAVVDRLFVYGSLRSGQAARSLISNHVAAAQPATARGRIYALSDGYPGFLPGDQGVVVGEVVTLTELAPAFALLDAYEGEEFLRVLHPIALADQGRIWAWTYVLADPALAEGGELIAGGDWAEYLRGG